MKKTSILLLLVTISFTLVFASGEGEEGRTGAQILRVNMSARSVALGGGGMALLEGVASMNMNPAAVADVGLRSLSLSHQELYDGVRMEYVAYGQKLMGISMGADIKGFYFSMDEIDSTGTPTGDKVSVYNTAASFAAGVTIGKNISLGGGATILYEYYGDDLSDNIAWGFNGGIRAVFLNDRLSFGASVRNASTERIGFAAKETRSFPMPLVYNAGLAYKMKNKELKDRMIICADIEYYWDREYVPSAGLEYYLKDWFALRAGYRHNEQNDYVDNISFGFGLSEAIKGLSGDFDYAYSVYGDMGAAHKITYSLKW